MPIKLILTLVLVALVTVFTGFNLGNSCNIWLFHTFEAVPVCVTILIAFAAGVFVTLPFTFGRRVKDVEQKKQRKAEKKAFKEAQAAKKAADKAAATAAKEKTSAPAVAAELHTEPGAAAPAPLPEAT